MNPDTLVAAHRQWASRPADQTFTSVADLHAAVTRHREIARTATVDIGTLRVEAFGGTEGGLALVGKTGTRALLSNWAFGQLAQRSGAPAGYLRELPATLAAQNLNHGLARLGREGQVAEDEKEVKLLLSAGPQPMMRAVTSDRYSRIWNNAVTEKAMQLVAAQPFWKLPLAYDRHKGAAGTPDANGMVPRGAYASDRDMFLFLVDEGREIAVPGSNPIKRGFFMWNSEVGAATFGITTFLYDYVCGNHYVWGAKDVQTIRIRHTGEANSKAFVELDGQVQRYAESSVKTIEGQIVRARKLLLGNSKEEVVSTVLAKRIPDLSKGRLEKAYDRAESIERYGDPRSVWAMVSGLTELAQETGNTDTRDAHDRAAGKVMEIAF
jgi:hypothetical protein